MKWFKHDSNASSDAKIKKLILKHGAIGYAVYFHCLELITADISESNLTFELEHDSEIIADNLKIHGDAQMSGCEIVENIMKTIVDLQLLQEQNNRIFCLKLLKRLDSSMTSNQQFRLKIQKSHDAVMIESCKTRLEQTRKEKNIQEQKKINYDKQSSKTKNKKSGRIQLLLQHWLNKNNLTRHREPVILNQLRRINNTILDSYTDDEIKRAIDHYSYIYNNNDVSWYTAKHDFIMFLNTKIELFQDHNYALKQKKIEAKTCKLYE